MRNSYPLSQALPKRKLEDMSLQELEAKLYLKGVEYPRNASKEELIAIIKKNK